MDRDCVPAVPKPRKRRTESAVGLESEQGMSLLEFAGPSSSSTAPPQFDPTRPNQADKVAERSFLLGRHDLSHVDSKSFVQLFRQGLGNILVSCASFPPILLSLKFLSSSNTWHCMYVRLCRTSSLRPKLYELEMLLCDGDGLPIHPGPLTRMPFTCLAFANSLRINRHSRSFFTASTSTS